MRAAAEHGAEGTHELALLIENHDAVGAGAVFIHRVVNVDVALGVLADAVRIAVLDIGRQFTPIVDAFVLVLALSKDRRLGAGLIVGLDEERYSGRCASGQKGASGGIRHVGAPGCGLSALGYYTPIPRKARKAQPSGPIQLRLRLLQT